MPGQQELQVQQKREVEKAQEATRPMRAFLPNTDIFETGRGPGKYRSECRERRPNR